MIPETLVGTWRIIETDLWEAEDLDLLAPATFVVQGDGLGDFRMGAIQADLDCRCRTVDNLMTLEFSWEGFEEGDHVSGRGWALLNGGRLEGKLFIHRGDEVKITAERLA